MPHIPDHQVDRAAFLVDSSGVVPTLQATMALNPQGRPRTLSLRTYLIGVYLGIEEEASFKSTTIHKVLTGLTLDKQFELGVRFFDASGKVQVITMDHVNYLSRSLPKRLSYTRDGAHRWSPHIEQAEMATRQLGFERAMADVLSASIVTPGWSCYALDGTNNWSWGRAKYAITDDKDVRTLEAVADDRVGEQTIDGTASAASPSPSEQEDDSVLPTSGKTSKKSSENWDPEAAIGTKTSKTGKRESYYGYVIDAAVRVSPPGEPAQPIVVERLLLSPASSDVVAPTLRILDELLATPGGVTDIFVDRHYSYKKVERWADELRARGINQHFDLRVDEHGFKDINGMRLAAGWMHCPATPDDLGTILRPGPGASTADKDQFADRIAERKTWAMDRHERINSAGRTRWKCPALAGKLGCPLRAHTVKVATRAGLPIVAEHPDASTAPACCTNSSGIVADKSDAMRKQQQPNYWGSPEWKAAYDRRTYVEGVFGSLKSRDTEGVTRGSTRFVGLVMVTIGITFAAAICNIRHQRKFWADDPARPDHPLLKPDTPHTGWKPLTQQEVDEGVNRTGSSGGLG